MALSTKESKILYSIHVASENDPNKPEFPPDKPKFPATPIMRLEVPGFTNVWLKDESKNPTGTHKDRMAWEILAELSFDVQIRANENAQRQEAEKERMELVAKAETAEKEKEAQMRRAAETSRVYQERVNKLLDYEMTGRSTRNDDRLFEDALKIYDTAIAEFPKDGDVARNMPKVMSSIYHGRAECLRMARKDYDGSIENALEAIALDKKNGNAYFELANSYAGKGEFDLADSNFQRAYELGVIDSLFTRGRLWFLVANQSDRLGHRTDALNQARRAVAIFDECLVNSRVVAADRASAEQYIKELRQKYSID